MLQIRPWWSRCSVRKLFMSNAYLTAKLKKIETIPDTFEQYSRNLVFNGISTTIADVASFGDWSSDSTAVTFKTVLDLCINMFMVSALYVTICSTWNDFFIELFSFDFCVNNLVSIDCLNCKFVPYPVIFNNSICNADLTAECLFSCMYHRLKKINK